MTEQKTETLSHLARAQLGLNRIDNSTSNDREYLRDIAKRVEIEALVSIAESLDALRTVLESWQKHGVHTLTEALC